MGTPTLVAIFFTTWWTVLFAVLPWGVRTPEQAEAGHADSAPVRPRLMLKFAVTTVLALVITAGIYYVGESGLISFREMAKGM
ncbi:DUF1467 family protein [Azospirillum sp.]|uniref:DUF1467 family protein n=1 Tax=Azospirillum sp. TaxID=34012 RepID=UPI002D319F6F|nr:DUF1467 family protein [Azospirillum sp.]HYD64848.1 DUF1467 family protein [Azospirillum sp.]